MDRLFQKNKKGDTGNLGGRRYLLEVGSQVHSYTWLNAECLVAFGHNTKLSLV